MNSGLIAVDTLSIFERATSFQTILHFLFLAEWSPSRLLNGHFTLDFSSFSRKAPAVQTPRRPKHRKADWGHILSPIQRSTISKGIDCRCFHSFGWSGPISVMLQRFMQYSLSFFLPSLAVFFARARHSDSRVKGSCTSQNGCGKSPSAVFALHAVGRWPTVFHALYQISKSITVQSGDNCRSYCIHLGRSGPLQVTLQCPIQRPLWSFPHNFTSPQRKGMAIWIFGTRRTWSSQNQKAWFPCQRMMGI